MADTSDRRVALVTGGARGIGRAIALDLAGDHAVTVSYLTSEPDTGLAGLHAVRADLRHPEDHARLVAEVIGRFGRLDIIVNNAGTLVETPLDTFDMAATRALWDVNVAAAQGVLTAALPHLGAGAAVVSISSVNAVLPPKGAALYGASKAALDLWTRAMAKELGPRGIRVNAVAPGAVNIPEAPRDPDLTRLFEEMTALGRLTRPEDIAAAVRFLSSDAASAITGEVLTVSGGYRL